MPYTFRRALAAVVVSCSFSACSTIQSAQRQAVRYNSAFSSARNEILLLNVLRARDREPLQFSTISNVSGPMRGNITAGGALDWLLHNKVEDKLSPTGSFTFRDPTVTLTPLDSKEFREGMMKPIGVGYFRALIDQGFTPEIVKALVAKQITCAQHEEPTTITRQAVVPAENAAEILREGAGDDVFVELQPSASSKDKVTVTYRTKRLPDAYRAVVPPTVCASETLDITETHLRSPLGMIMYLGEHASASYPYLRVVDGDWHGSEPPLVSTLYRETHHYIPRDPTSAETLALLAEIIGFQTSSAQLNASKPTLTVPTD